MQISSASSEGRLFASGYLHRRDAPTSNVVQRVRTACRPHPATAHELAVGSFRGSRQLTQLGRIANDDWQLYSSVRNTLRLSTLIHPRGGALPKLEYGWRRKSVRLAFLIVFEVHGAQR